jgi:hypothetical protein
MVETLRRRRNNLHWPSNIYRLGKCGVRYCSWLAPAGRPLASNAFSESWRDVQPDHCVLLPVHSACTAT